MPALYNFPEGQIIAFALVFLRIIAFVIACPIFGSATVPAPVKILFSLTFAVILYPSVAFSGIDMLKIGDEIIFLVIRETFVGLALGFLMRMFFFAISIAGEIISVSMGLASAQIFNPAMGAQSNVIEQFELTLATLFFLAINGHHLFIQGMAESFHLIPIAAIAVKTQGFASITQMVQEILLIGLKISSPILVAIFVTNMAMGIIGRAVPQINVLVTSMPITMLLGIFIMIATTPLFLGEMHGLLNLMTERFFQFMRVI